MTFIPIYMAVFLTIILILILCWPTIRKWSARFVANRTEDYIRRATGMPPRPGSREERRQAKQNAQSGSASRQSSRRSNSSTRRTNTTSTPSNEPLIPKEYAEDVEFVETINYSETVIGATSSDGRNTVYHESQVSDVEWEEIRLSKVNSKKRS